MKKIGYYLGLLAIFILLVYILLGISTGEYYKLVYQIGLYGQIVWILFALDIDKLLKERN